ncbi:hypothetical protein NDU88_005673 [Pleurodeles waltl]|uniref:Uncharacterized protein n=1 Tax=Pleurodeles waltl TaxID=8319 RepID=A0AAV7QGD1_PLEWA|nr:hypothetical protein NDU88_005673 [Pleurodeles waltl]
MTYASPMWSGCKLRYRKALQTLQNRALRIAAGAPCFARTVDLHRDLGIEMLDDHLRTLNVEFYKGLDQKENPLIKKLSDISANPFDHYPRPITAITMRTNFKCDKESQINKQTKQQFNKYKMCME